MEKRMKHFDLSSKKAVLPIALICTMLWGTAYSGVKTSYRLFNIDSADTASVMLLAGYRFLFAGLFCLIFCFIKHKKVILPARESRTVIIWNGLTQTVLQYIFFYIGLAHTTGVKSSIISATASFWSVILSHFFFKEKITTRKFTGCLIGFAGIMLIHITGSNSIGGFGFGDGLMLLSAICASLGAMISKIASQKGNPILVTGYQMSFGGFIIILTSVLLGGHVEFVSILAVVLLLYLVFVSAVAFALWTVLHKYNEPGKIAIYNFLIPIFGTIFSAVFLKESLGGIKTFVALVCVCLGIYISNTVPHDWNFCRKDSLQE